MVVSQFEKSKQNMFADFRRKKSRSSRAESDLLDDIFFFDADWTYLVNTTQEYENMKTALEKASFPKNMDKPAYLEILESCNDCAILEQVEPEEEQAIVEEILFSFNPEEPNFEQLGDPMVDSLTGAIMDVDLCTAVNRQLVLTLFAKGTPPFEGKVVGLPDELKPIVKVLINQEEPFDTTVTILNTDIWKENGQEFFFVNLKDSAGSEGSVYVKVCEYFVKNRELYNSHLAGYCSIFCFLLFCLVKI